MKGSVKIIFSICIFALLLLSSVNIYAEEVTYTYDDYGRLLQAAYGDGTTIVYSYDEQGNRTYKTVTVAVAVDGNAIIQGQSPVQYYETAQEAYDAAGNEAVILCKNGIVMGNIVSNKSISATFTGGYNADFTSVIGRSTICKVTMTTGILTFGNMILNEGAM